MAKNNISFGVIATKKWTISLIKKVLEKMGATKKKLVATTRGCMKDSGKTKVSSSYTALNNCKVIAYYSATNAGKEGDCYSSAVVTYICDNPNYITERIYSQTGGYSAYFNVRLYELKEGQSIKVEGESTAANSNNTPMSGIIVIEEEGYADLDYEFVGSGKWTNTNIGTYTHTIQDKDEYLIQLVLASGSGYSPTGLTLTTDNPGRYYYGDETHLTIGAEIETSRGQVNMINSTSYSGFVGLALFRLNRKTSPDETLSVSHNLTSTSSTFHSHIILIAKQK